MARCTEKQPSTGKQCVRAGGDNFTHGRHWPAGHGGETWVARPK